MSHYAKQEADGDAVVKGKPESYTAKAEEEVEMMGMEVHPLSQKLFDAAPCAEYVPLFGPILKAYSPRLVAAICVERLFVKGVCHGLMRRSIQPMLTERYGLSGAMYQRLSSLYELGWSVNSFFSAVADTFALFGYTKRWYCVFYTVAGGAFALLYALLPAKESSATSAAAFTFMTGLFLVNVDTFAQAIYSRRIRRNPASGAALVSWAWASSKVGGMIGAAVQGPLSDHNITQVGVYVAAGVLFCLSFLFIFNLFGEQPNRVARVEDAKTEFIAKKRDAQAAKEKELPHATEPSYMEEAALMNSEQVAEDEDDDFDGFEEPEVKSVLWGAIQVNLEVVTHNWLMVIYCCVMTAAVVVTAVVTILGTRWDMMYACVVVSVVICAAAFFTLPLVVAKAAVFTYAFSVVYLSLPGVLNTFYVAKPSCLANGPHFSYTFYTIMNGVVGNVGCIAAVIFFAHFCQNFSYRGIMGAAGIIIPFISMFDLIIVKRWNVYIGIPDQVVYIFGDAIIFDTIDFLLRMPTFLLLSRVAPRGSEAMVLALLDAVNHLGLSTSSSIGYLLLETIWPVTTKGKGKCDYHNAPWLIITGHIVAPLLITPLAFLLLPSARVCATLDARGNEVEEIVLPRDNDTSSSDSSVFTTSSDSSHPSRPSHLSDGDASEDEKARKSKTVM